MAANIYPRLQLFGAAVLFSTGGVAIKATDLDGWQVAGLRTGVAALTIALLAPSARRAWNLRVAPVACAYATMMICFVVANKLTTAANAIFLQSTAPLYILIASPWLLRERARGRDIVLMGVLAAGVVPFLIGSESASVTAPDPGRGNFVALGAGVAWAATVIGIRWLVTASPGGGAAYATVLAGNLIACAACLVLAAPIAATAGDWLVVAYLGVFQVGVAYLLLLSAVRHVAALEASIILLAEPALSPLWAWLVHGERASGWALLGGGIILTATVAAATWDLTGPRAGAPAKPVSGPQH